MAKSAKATVRRRVQELLRLILAGGEFPDIEQYATDHGWDVSKRQLHRYQDAAYQQLVAISQRAEEELFGRHIVQRRALYSRALKKQDLKTALAVLRDEAALQGLYPPAKIAQTDTKGRDIVPKEVVELVVRSRGEAIDFAEYRQLQEAS